MNTGTCMRLFGYISLFGGGVFKPKFNSQPRWSGIAIIDLMDQNCEQVKSRSNELVLCFCISLILIYLLRVVGHASRDP